MKKIDLGQTINTTANIGVIAGIAFLAVEISQNTRSAEVNAYQDLVSQISQLGYFYVEDFESVDELNLMAQQSVPGEVSEEWERRIDPWLFTLTRLGDLAYYQYERGLIPEERMESSLGPLRVNWCTEYYAYFWSRNRSGFVSNFQEFIDSKMDAC